MATDVSAISPTGLTRAGMSGAGALAALVALVVIWAVRFQTPQALYVSELGSPSLPSAPTFNAALLLLAGGGVLAGLGAAGAPRAPRLLGFWTVSASLIAAGGLFAFASQVTCTPGCPIPFTPASTVQDLAHVVAAALGFAAATWAMLQIAWAGATPGMRNVSRAAAVLVGAVASAGGIFSVLRFRTDIGGSMEFLAMSVAVLWLVGFAGMGAATALARASVTRASVARASVTRTKHVSASIVPEPWEAPDG